jgi:hypothetical protein
MNGGTSDLDSTIDNRIAQPCQPGFQGLDALAQHMGIG